MAQDIVEGIKAFKKDKNAVLLDVRTFEEYENQHVNGSINIPIQTLGQIRLKVKNLSTPLYVYCQSGVRSRAALKKLTEMGYSNVKDIGGITNVIFDKEFYRIKLNVEDGILPDELENERRQGNLVLNLCKFIKPEYFERKRKYKPNDKRLKRSLGISRNKIDRACRKFFRSFGSESELLERDFTHRLHEIEEEIERERKKNQSSQDTGNGSGETK